MKNKIMSNTMKVLFDFYVPNSEVDGGFIENTKIFKLINETVKGYKPEDEETIKFHCFELAVKMASIEFYQGDNHGFYDAESYLGLVKSQYTYINIEDLVGVCFYYNILNEFSIANLDFDDENLLVKNRKTKEIISYDNIKTFVGKLIEYELTIQINIVKIILKNQEHRNKIIEHISGNKNEEYIESANNLFDRLMEL